MVRFKLLNQHMNCWMEILMRKWDNNQLWTVARSWTASLSPSVNGYVSMLSVNPALRGTLDGRTRPYPSWDVVRYVSKDLSMYICFV